MRRTKLNATGVQEMNMSERVIEVGISSTGTSVKGKTKIVVNDTEKVKGGPSTEV